MLGQMLLPKMTQGGLCYWGLRLHFFPLALADVAVALIEAVNEKKALLSRSA